MTLFQTLLLVLLSGLFLGTLVSVARGWATWREGLSWAVVWLAAGIAVAWPDVTAVAAGALGIGRGADLVLYCAVIMMMLGFLMVYARLRRLRREMTLLVRQLAIRDAVASGSEAGGSRKPGREVR